MILRMRQKQGFVVKLKNSQDFAKVWRKRFAKRASRTAKYCKTSLKNFVGTELPQNDEDSLSTTLQVYMPRFLRYGTRANYVHNGSFHEAMSPVLVMAQFFCLMPVRGICSKTPSKLSFQWHSCRTWYCCAYVLTTIMDTMLSINMVFKGHLDVINMDPIVFHISILLASIGFLRLAAKWPVLMRKWERVEKQLPAYETWQQREELPSKIKKVAFVLTMLSLMEHLLSTISAIHFANFCPSRKDPIESYFLTVVSQIFIVFDYTPWLAWPGKIQNVLLTFGWNYMDIFVGLIGIGLSSLFERLQRSIDHARGQPMPETFWTEKRQQYRAIADLVEEVDDAISGITMLSFANNLYFVCMQLLKSMNKMPSVAHTVYFYFSLTYLLGRTVAVSLFLADLNDRSRDPLPVLKLVPKQAYSIEVQRFANEIAVDCVALTGLKYFDITRKLVLTVAGTIVTYELVLIQFHNNRNVIFDCGQK